MLSLFLTLVNCFNVFFCFLILSVIILYFLIEIFIFLVYIVFGGMNMKGKFSRETRTNFLITIIGMFLITLLCTFYMMTFEFGDILNGVGTVIYLFSIAMVLVGLITKNEDGNKYLKAATWTYVIGGILMYVISILRLFTNFTFVDAYGIDRILNFQHLSLILTTSSIFVLNIIAVWLVMKAIIPLDKKHTKELAICRQFYVSGLTFVILKFLSINSNLLLETTFAGTGYDYISFNFMSTLFDILQIIACVWFVYSICKLFTSVLKAKTS